MLRVLLFTLESDCSRGESGKFTESFFHCNIEVMPVTFSGCTNKHVLRSNFADIGNGETQDSRHRAK